MSGKSSSFLREPSLRVTILVVVISGHLGLLMLLLRPVIFYRNTTAVGRSNLLVLKLRFLQPPRPSSPHPALPALPAHQLIAPAVYSHATLLTTSSKPPAAEQAAHIGAQPYETRSTSVRNPAAREDDSIGDGGFRQRLRSAQRSYSVHGVPGSDKPFAPGIHLVDPISQGIGAVMRTAQRAFGIKNGHCIDVDAWRHLTPQELSARHISPSDVDEVDEKYGCNMPPGLHF